jgi:hypothetical protein
MGSNEEEIVGEAISIGFADEHIIEPPPSVADRSEYLETVDNHEQPPSNSSWTQQIRINQKDRAVESPVFRDSLAIRAGIIVVVVTAFLGLAWIARSLFISSHLPSNPSIQIANSSANISDSKADLMPPVANAVRETVGELSNASPERLSSATSNIAKPSLEAAAPGSSSVIGNSSGLPRQRSATRPSGKEAASRTKLTPVPESRPTTINGWRVREVTNGLAAIEGPNGIWRVRRGDAVPGLGRIDSIVLWGQRWIVATSQGLISTP